MDSTDTELDMAVLKAEREVDAARQRRDAYRRRVLQKKEDADYLNQLATWLGRETATCNCAAPSDISRLQEIAERLKAIVLRE